ncbi:50S ribosomal protein L10 [Fulvivirgaceae bacterium BMA12]|uniref:Large ribosomal subunit protein uL10 n=1 Tax=Agaribacillus aureus TaxID=3051825 RepID=A0ABT8L5N7_9BACT|nr:50S ribosomal protein L10 [Fulvivirgaceae bacterium BMA12]
MTKEEKINVVAELTEKFKANSNFYLTDASGFTVAQVNDFRRLCFEKGVEYRVYKNTMIKKALENMEADFSSLDDALKGFSGVIFSEEVANLPAKVIKEFRKKQGGEKPALKAASINTDIFIGEESLNTLSDLKSKTELIGEVISLLQSPAKNVISALQSGGNTLSGLVKALSEKEN